MRILILGGTSDASALADSLVGDQRFTPTLSLAGVTSNPRLPPIDHRIGGFGGVAGLAAWLREQRVEALVDATHPFATRISANAVAAAAEAGVAHVRIDRPAWSLDGEERWTETDSIEEAAAYLGRRPLRVLLTVGRTELAPFAAQPQHAYVIRSVEPPPPETLPPRCRLIAARGPFRLEDERRLFVTHRIQVLVTRNSGGQAAAAKLAVAREGLFPVILVRRPMLPAAETVPDWRDALAWLERRHAQAATERVV